MAFLGIRVPPEVARMLAEVPEAAKYGDPEPLNEFHITMVHFGDSLAVETLAEALAPVFAVTSKTRPFTVQTSHITTFPPHPVHHTVPIIARIDSQPLQDLRDRVCKGLKTAGVEYDNKFPEFKPHVTLAYSPDPAVAYDGVVDRHIPVVEWGVQEIQLWGGDKGDNKLIVTFPFSLGIPKEAVFRAFVRLAMTRGQSDSAPVSDTARRVVERFRAR